MSSTIRVALIISAAFSLIFQECFCELVDIEDGIINGTLMKTRSDESFHAFLKIPFAEKPLSNLRFKAPQPVTKWNGVLQATKFSPMCMQVNVLSNSEVSEDCLYLNVFTKNLQANTNLKPVIVYIHGGAFQLGSASDHEPNLLMERDIVLVSINYRLGALGFLSMGTEEIPGNAGFKDQVLALRWVQKNIVKFGGNPELVTLMGNSAGAYSATAHMVSPMSKGLFRRVVALSGSVTYQRKLESSNSILAEKLAAKMNCSKSNIDDMVACLREKAPSDFNLIELREYPTCTIMTWFPVIEVDFGQERFLTDDPVKLFRDGNFTQVPLIIGRTRDEFVDIPSRMIHEDIIEKLNIDFEEVAPHCFFYEFGTDNSKKISKSLRKAYFPHETIDIRSFNSLSNIFSDGYIGFGVHRLAHLASNFTEVFYYQLSFIGQYSYFHYPHDKPFGVHHSDEMQYIMTTVFVGPQIQANDIENIMVERFTRILAQFALTGNPNNDTDLFLKDMNWPKLDLKDEFYLDMGIHLVQKNGLSLDRYVGVWDSFENSSAMSMKINFIVLFLTYLFRASSLLLK